MTRTLGNSNKAKRTETVKNDDTTTVKKNVRISSVKLNEEKINKLKRKQKTILEKMDKRVQTPRGE